MPAVEANVDTVTVSLNGQEVQARMGQTILDVARENGVDIPTLCHDPRLEPYGACRLCLVEVEGARGPMAACGAKVSEGMKIQTHTEKIVKLRKFILELLLTNHPLDCPVCEAAGDCRLQDYAYEYLVDMVPWGWRAPQASDPGSHPNIAHHGSRCILCGRCVRICREVMSIGCWGYVNRGYESEVDTPYRLPLQEVGCVSCGQCVSACPVGAVTTQRTQFGARPWQTEKTRTVCSYCSNGCELLVHSYNGRVVKVTAELGQGLNQGNLCVRGRFGQGFANAPDRVLKPMVRNAVGELVETTWDEALDRIVSEAQVARSSAGDGFAAIVGAQCTNETAFLMQKLAREVFSSHNVASCDLSKRRTADDVLRALVGSTSASWSTSDRADLSKADVILLVGTNITESNPVLALAVIKAMRQGKTVIVVDPRTTESARRASIHLAVKPGGDLALLRGLLAHIVVAGLEDSAAVSGLKGHAELVASLRAVDVEAAADEAGVDGSLLRQAAEVFAAAGTAAILFGNGVAEGAQAAEVISALVDLAVLTGNMGRPGGGLFPLYYSANAQGLADMGVDSPPSKTVAEILDTAENGTVRLLYVVGDDPALAVADEIRTRVSLEKAPFVVVQDSFFTETASYADVLLPSFLPTETDGTYTNAEGYVQRVRPVAATWGDSKSDWAILTEVAARLGAGWAYTGPDEVMADIAASVPGYEGLTHPALEAGGRRRRAVTSEPVAQMAAIASTTSTDRDVPSRTQTAFRLITGSVREHHGTGVRSSRSEGLFRLVPEARAAFNPADAERLSLAEGDTVSIAAEGDKKIDMPVTLTEAVPAGSVFVPGFSAKAPVTRLLTRGLEGAVTVTVERV